MLLLVLLPLHALRALHAFLVRVPPATLAPRDPLFIGLRFGGDSRLLAMSGGSIGDALLLTFAYSLLGIAVFGIGFAIIAKIAPFSIRKEIEEDQNVALAILIGAVILGLSIIIASAVGG